MADLVDMIIPMLRETREMRAENSLQHEQTRGLIETLARRVSAIEEAQASMHQALLAIRSSHASRS